MDVSVDAFDQYEASGSNTLDMVRDADRYLSTIAGRLSELDQEERKPSRLTVGPLDVCLPRQWRQLYVSTDYGL
jgi:hypothetical protein